MGHFAPSMHFARCFRLHNNDLEETKQMFSRLAKILASTLAGLALALSSAAAHAVLYDALFVFGDSLSDGGNAYAATAGAIPPSPPYAQRFSNGPVAVEYLAQHFGIPLQNSLAGGTNYAFGGAETGTGNFLAHPALANTGLLNQVTAFAVSGTPFDPNRSLFVLWGGPNDFFALGPSPTEAQVAAAIANAIANLQSEILILAGLGARHILVPSMADLGETPFGQSLGPAGMAALNALSNAFNLGLAQLLDLLDPLLPADLIPFDTPAVVAQVVANADAYGLLDVLNPCILVPSCVSDPQMQQHFLFWDSVHPTTRTHQILASFFANVVPEPATPLLLGTALMILLALRRRARMR